MALVISEVGLEDYAPGGKARLKVLITGGPAVGKSLWSSFFPRPFYADCEKGLASVARSIAKRKVKIGKAEINGSKDMIDLLAFLKEECRKPDDRRTYDTIVIDTIDSFQRKVQDEWIQANPHAKGFTGYDAWNYLDDKMKILMTRVMNLDMNVIVLVHSKENETVEGSGQNQVKKLRYGFLLQGQSKDNLTIDFDLVGRMGTYFDVVDGERVEKRGLTFRPTETMPFLKDRMNITPPWIPVNFHESDYTDLMALITEGMEGIPDSVDVGIVPEYSGHDSYETEDNLKPVLVEDASSGPIPPVDPKDIPLAQNDVVTLKRIAKEEGLKLAGNLLKGELIKAIEDHRNTAKEAENPSELPQQALQQARLAVPESGVIIDASTGEILERTESEVTGLVQSVLGGEIVSEDLIAGPLCDECNTFGIEESDRASLNKMRTKKSLCKDCLDNLAK